MMNKAKRKYGFLLMVTVLIAAACVSSLNLGSKMNQAASAQTMDNASIFTFTRTNDNECSVRLKDKTVETAIIPATAVIDGKEYQVTSIAANGFSSAANLQKVRMRSNLKSIGNSAFANCKKLSSITLPAVEKIGSNVFQLCTSLNHIVLPKTILSVGSTIFRSASVKVYVRASHAETVDMGWSVNWNGSNGNQEIEYASNFTPELQFKKIAVQDLENVSVYGMRSNPEFVVTLDNYQEFQEEGRDNHVYVPGVYFDEQDNTYYDVVKIENNAFTYNNVTTLTIGYANTPIYIESYAFSGMGSEFSGEETSKITINREVIFEEYGELSEGVFSDSVVNSIILPKNIKAIGSYFFSYCYNLSNIHFIEPQAGLTKEQEKMIGSDLELDGIVDLPEGLEFIGDSAFGSINGINVLNIPSTVTTVLNSIIVDWGVGQKVHINISQTELPDWDENTQTGWYPDWNQQSDAVITYKDKPVVTFTADWEGVVIGLTEYSHAVTVDHNSEFSQIKDIPMPVSVSHVFNNKWYKDIDRTIEITAGEILSESITLYAGWDIKNFEVRFQDSAQVRFNSIEGETLNGEALRLNYGNDFKFIVTVNDVYESTNLTVRDNGTIISANQGGVYTVSIDEEHVITTDELPLREYRIYYHENGGIHSLKPDSYNSTESVTLVNPTKLGYTFLGWYENMDCTGEPVAVIPQGSKNDKEFWAKWENNSYTVKYMPNWPKGTGEGETISSAHKYNETGNLNINDFSVKGYHFIGWRDKDNTYYSEGQSVTNLTAEQNGEIVLYAQWEGNNYKVNYNSNNTKAVGEMEKTDHTYDTPSGLTANAYALTGYMFKGWSRSKTGAVELLDGQIITQLTEIDDYTVELYAVWEPIKYYISYEPNIPQKASSSINETPVSVQAVYDQAASVRSGYTLRGWNFIGWKDKDGNFYAAGSTVINLANENNKIFDLYAQWEQKQYTITFNTGYAPYVTKTVKYDDAIGELPTATKGNLKFYGWSKEKFGALNVSDSMFYRIESNITVYAQWLYPQSFSQKGQGIITQYEVFGTKVFFPAVEITNQYKAEWVKPADNSRYPLGSYYTVEGVTEFLLLKTEKLLSESYNAAIDCYEIYSFNQLNQLRDEPNGGKGRSYKIMNDMAPAVYTQMWTPIQEFNGTLDGQNFLIDGIKMNYSEVQHLGFIVNNNGIVRYVRMRYEFNIPKDYSNVNVGGIAANNKSSGIIEYCHFEGAVIHGTAIMVYAGGVAGANYGTVRNCFGDFYLTNSCHMGGIVGINYGVVDNCVVNSDSRIYFYSADCLGRNVGGVVGEAVSGSTVTNNSYYGRVEYRSGLNNVDTWQERNLQPHMGAIIGHKQSGVTLSGNNLYGTVDASNLNSNVTWKTGVWPFQTTHTFNQQLYAGNRVCGYNE